MHYNTVMRIFQIYIMLFLLSACSEIDQDQNSEIKLKEGNVNEDLDLLRKDFEEQADKRKSII